MVGPVIVQVRPLHPMRSEVRRKWRDIHISPLPVFAPFTYTLPWDTDVCEWQEVSGRRKNVAHGLKGVHTNSPHDIAKTRVRVSLGGYHGVSEHPLAGTPKSGGFGHKNVR